jgi:transposase
MDNGIKFVGLDVHQETIAVAVASLDGEVCTLGTIRNEPDAIARLMRRLGPAEKLWCCYEAGPCGYTVQRQLQRLNIACQVVAPSLIPMKPGDRVKTDRRDALKLARLLRSGDLTPVWVPDEEHEALRDLTRARETAVQDQTRARHRISKLLLRLGMHRPHGLSAWSKRHHQWLRTVRLAQPAQQIVFEELLQALSQAEQRVERLTHALEQMAASSAHAAVISALQALRGVALVTAVSLVAELGDLTRFRKARQAMGYVAAVPRERSSGGHQKRGGITKAGNQHARFALVEASWHYRHLPKAGSVVTKRRSGQPKAVLAIAAKAEQRLHRRFVHLLARGKSRQQTVVAVSRELVGFVWAIGQVAQPAGVGLVAA